MNGLPYYKAYPRDFIEGTVGMSFELKGAYRLILDLIYMQGGQLPDDPRYISGLLGCSTRAWNKYRKELVIQGKIYAENGIISNFRADKELESLRTLQDKQRENAKKSRKNNDVTLAMAKPKPSHTEPEPKVSKETLYVEKCFSEVWGIWSAKGRQRSKRKELCLAAFKRQLKRTDADSLTRACKMFAKTTDGQYQPALDRWLADGKWENWLGKPRVVSDQTSQPVISYEPSRSDWEHWADHLIAIGEWIPASQKPPGHPDCKMPKDLLDRIPSNLRTAA